MKALDKLSLLAEKVKLERYPSIPRFALAKAKYQDRDANGLTKCVIDYFSLNGYYATRIQVQGQYNEKVGKWTKSTTAKGTADVHACMQGRHVSIEVKIGRDTQSEYQVETQRKVEAAGGLYFIAKDFQSFYDWVEGKKKEVNI